MLVDSNTLLRTLQPGHQQHSTASQAILNLSEQGEELCIVPQNLIEVWAVATRPNDASNGLGMSIEQASDALRRFKDLFTIYEDTPEIYRVWEALVAKHRVSGKANHDARLVAAMQVHGVTSILTFNAADFVRYPSITVVRPGNVAGVGL